MKSIWQYSSIVMYHECINAILIIRVRRFETNKIEPRKHKDLWNSQCMQFFKEKQVIMDQ